MPAGASSARASTIAKPASGLEQNHLSPARRQLPSAWRCAVVAVAAMSEPAACSVMNIAPCASSSKSSEVRRGRYLATSSGAPNFFSVRVSESVIETGQHRPNSACTKR
ncbi:hypothetical protein D3C72_1534460 [compost metagenome]